MNRWPTHKAWFWEKAPFFRILMPFAAGILGYYTHCATGLSLGCLLIAISILFLLFAAIVLSNKKKKIPAIVPFVIVQVLLVSAGYAISYINDIQNNKAWFGNHLGKGSYCLARISEIPAEKEHSWKLNIDIIKTIKNGRILATKGSAFLYMYKDQSPMFYHKGDSILIPGNWQPIQNSGNPFEFDYAAYCMLNNIKYQQFCSVQAVRLYGANEPLATPITVKAHDWCMRQLDHYFTDAKTRGLIQAMLLGDEINLDSDLRQSYSDTGIVHVIAISGANVMLFFTFISYLLWWVKHKKHKWIKFLVALPLVWFYVIMAGSSPSAIRAAFFTAT